MLTNCLIATKIKKEYSWIYCLQHVNKLDSMLNNKYERISVEMYIFYGKTGMCVLLRNHKFFVAETKKFQSLDYVN